MMPGQMMELPLSVSHLLARAEAFFPRTEVVTRAADRSIERTTYAGVLARAARLARALERAGVREGDRVATLAWNHARHLELYLAVPAMGAVVHTLNLRLHPDEIGYIAAHAGDKVAVVDASLLPLFEKARAKAPCIERALVVGAAPSGYDDYDALVDAEAQGPYAWRHPDERSAAMICYTSGTTGLPKGVVYSHRSIVLHTLAVLARDTLGVGEDDTVLPVVPMFHACAWGLPYAAVMAGAKLVFPGPHLDPESLLDLMAAERVTIAAGVPTIWLGILALLDQHPKRWDLSSLRTMVVGGAAAPPALISGFAERHGIRITHAWGMTEMNPLGTVARVKQSLAAASDEVRLAARASQGYAVPLVEQRHVADDGRPLPWDGTSMGELEVRGPWVASSYLHDEDPSRWTADGWFKTGDVVTIDPEGYVRITDRSKDVVKSGGEWISSVALENALMGHPAVLEAAVFAGQHATWGERPIAAVVFKKGQHASAEELVAFLGDRFPKFWTPELFLELDAIPRTSTGKFLKTKLRELYGKRLLEGGA
ncbi:MAG TPA: long-chain fatty acid--CoA ligase [Minicystis sp.]|nr:long-chain fatty acid--CoA ligase [Minicystis sp.]